jgi:hypothetical protein
MRTKLLAAAAILAAGFATVQAQNVYSLNVVGYVNVTANPGYTLVSTPLVPANAAISTLLDDGANGNTVVPAGSTVFTFNGAFVGNFSDEFGAGWSNPTQQLPNGTGYFFLNNSGSPTTITFVGEVPQGALSTPLNPGYNLVGSKVPQGGFLADLGLVSTDGDFVYKFVGGSFAGYFKDEFGSGWASSQPDVDPVKGPNLNVAEGMFYFRSDLNGAPTWNRNFTVQP